MALVVPLKMMKSSHRRTCSRFGHDVSLMANIGNTEIMRCDRAPLSFEWIAGIRHDRDAGQDEESQYRDVGMNGISKDAISFSKPAKLSDSISASI